MGSLKLTLLWSGSNPTSVSESPTEATHKSQSRIQSGKQKWSHILPLSSWGFTPTQGVFGGISFSQNLHTKWNAHGNGPYLRTPLIRTQGDDNNITSVTTNMCKQKRTSSYLSCVQPFSHHSHCPLSKKLRPVRLDLDQSETLRPTFSITNLRPTAGGRY